jgi:hypothetical protein
VTSVGVGEQGAMTEPRGGWVQYLSGLLHATERPPTLVELPRANQKVAVLTLLRREQRWPGSPPERFRSVPNKPTLQFNDQPTWGEFALLRLLEGDGWNGAWVKNWGGRAFWRDVEEVTVLSAAGVRAVPTNPDADGRTWRWLLGHHSRAWQRSPFHRKQAART